MLDRFLEWLVGLPPLAVWAVLAVLSALENVFPPVPADVAVVIGAFLGSRGLGSPIGLGVLCWLSNCGSAALVYHLARQRGEHFLEHRWGAALLPPPAREALRASLHRRGAWGVFASRFLPGFRAAVPPFVGMMKLPPARVLPPIFGASAIWYTLLISAGSALGLSLESARELLDDVNRVLGALAAVCIVGLVAWLWRVRRARGD